MVIHQRAAAILRWAATSPVEDPAATGDSDSALLMQRLDLYRPSTRGATQRTPAAARAHEQGVGHRGVAAWRTGFTVAQMFLPDFVASFGGALGSPFLGGLNPHLSNQIGSCICVNSYAHCSA